jgi:hypothetical protein
MTRQIVMICDRCGSHVQEPYKSEQFTFLTDGFGNKLDFCGTCRRQFCSFLDEFGFHPDLGQAANGQ